MVGIELVRDKTTKERYAWEEKIGIKTIREARARGVILRPLGDVIVLMPPFCITEKQLSTLVEVTAASIESATS
jgi:adenosylmethionine-8-amino-7-oxononanoate aminotransferase